MNINAESVYKKLALNSKAPQHNRIKALAFIRNPSYALLRKLIDDTTCPGRLQALASDLYVKKMALRQIARESK